MEYVRTPDYKPISIFMVKLQTQIRTQIAFLILLLIAVDEVVRVKEDVNDTLDRCGTEVIADDHPDAVLLGWERNPSLQCSNYYILAQSLK